MSKEICVERAARLFATKRAELKEARLREAVEINGRMNRSGVFHSSMRLQELDRLYRQNLKASVEAAWQILSTTHKALGSEVGDEMRQAHKSWIGDTIRSLQHEMSGELVAQVARSKLGRQWIDTDLTEAANLELQRYDPLIDNYFDMEKNEQKGSGSVVINAQTIGAVVTGEHAVVRIKQDGDAVRRLAEALSTIKDQVAVSPHVSDRARAELEEIALDAELELAKAEPNEKKLLMSFTVLGQAIQTLPDAKPAYDTIRGVLAPFGINLP
jgi:hypothetical protein